MDRRFLYHYICTVLAALSIEAILLSSVESRGAVISVVVSICAIVLSWIQFDHAKQKEKSDYLHRTKQRFSSDNDILAILDKLRSFYQSYKKRGLSPNRDDLVDQLLMEVIINTSKNSEDRKRLDKYLRELELLSEYVMLHHVPLAMVDSLFRDEFFLAVNNPFIAKDIILKHKDDLYRQIVALAEKWNMRFYYQRKKVPMMVSGVIYYSDDKNVNRYKTLKLIIRIILDE